MLRTLSTKCHNYSEQSLRSWWTWHRPRWNQLSHVTKNGKRSHMTTYPTYSTYQAYQCTSLLNVLTYSVITIGGVMYLKDRSPCLDSPSLYSKSQNTIKINLLGTLLHNQYFYKTYLSILPSLICIPYSISYKCP